MKRAVVSVVIFILTVNIFNSCDLSCSGRNKICDGEQCIYISKRFEKDVLGINESAEYWYLTDALHNGKDCVPFDNYLKIRYSDESLFYVRWDLDRIEILYSSVDVFDNLTQNSGIRFGEFDKVNSDSLKPYYKGYALEDF